MTSTTLQLGLARFELQGLELHGQAHVPSDLQLALEECLQNKQRVIQLPQGLTLTLLMTGIQNVERCR